MAKKWVKMKTSFGGARKSLPAGSVHELDEKEADRFVEKGHAEFVDPPGGAKKRTRRTKKATEERD